MKKRLILGLLLFCILSLEGCIEKTPDNIEETPSSIISKEDTEDSFNGEESNTDELSGSDENYDETGKDEITEEPEETFSFIAADGKILEERIHVPEGYQRTSAEEGSFTEFLRKYPLKKDGSPVLLFDGSEKGNQSAHAAVLKLPIASEDLQQCADSVMRIYAEYFWATGQYEQIAFHFTNGFLAEYTKWRDGNRISIDGNEVYWSSGAGYDDSYENFAAFMRVVFCYAGTLSMEQEAEPITMEEMQPGDVFLMGASPGHVVMVIDICENEMGQKAFLLAQGYMPAQEFHILKNPLYESDPWYYENEMEYPFVTPEYTFDEGSLKRLSYLEASN